ncbi:hypothetical protein LOZ80_39075 [Paenibacillus sp. HWE-109]|uniref:hypothetical protein n=1 Tax=Paenibacillus sp. HWE-109 TaxID=1306526 RepID=UPI001EE04A59|nr:hypothetical protein [Paenibacillus sp. HWE-109]UKS27370.1 hypothetical protein LOZ80_39075 [Paenibacillus sp. HWE-109]
MKLIEFTKLFNLHDSVINNLTYIPNQFRLRLEIDLCNYDQSWFKQNDPEIVTGFIEFTEVTAYEIEPQINCSEEINGSILNVSDVADNCLKIVFTTSEVQSNYSIITNTFVLLVTAESVQWKSVR